MKLIQLDEVNNQYQVKYFDNGVEKTNSYTTYNDAIDFINTLDLL